MWAKEGLHKDRTVKARGGRVTVYGTEEYDLRPTIVGRYVGEEIKMG